MQTIKEVKAWKTSDGDLFLVKDQAQAHQNFINFEEWYKSNPLFTNDGIMISFSDMTRFLNTGNNWEELKSHFESIGTNKINFVGREK